jgi:hypothetical protein
MDYMSEVKRLFAHAPDRSEELRCNPVTGGRFHGRLDPVGEQEREAYRALRARAWYAKDGPQHVQPLPLSYDEREHLKHYANINNLGGLPHIVAWFARSLAYRDNVHEGHPSFGRYVCGVLASPQAPDFIKNDASLQCYQPCLLEGLNSGLIWKSESASVRNAPRDLQRHFLRQPPPPATSSGRDLINRVAVNVPDDYAPQARHFLQLNNDAFIAHATSCAPSKRLPRGWRVHTPGEALYRQLGNHRLWVVASDYGWLIDREHLLNKGDKEVLTYFFIDAPVLCPTHVIAARLAQASYPDPAHQYMLAWQSMN